MVMEPVHGGMLADLPEECLKLLPKTDVSPAAWALRFVMNLPGVSVVLSGMSDMRQTEENVNTAASESQLTEEELSKLEKISSMLRKKIAVPCTGFGYSTLYEGNGKSIEIAKTLLLTKGVSE